MPRRSKRVLRKSRSSRASKRIKKRSSLRQRTSKKQQQYRGAILGGVLSGLGGAFVGGVAGYAFGQSECEMAKTTPVAPPVSEGKSQSTNKPTVATKKTTPKVRQTTTTPSPQDDQKAIEYYATHRSLDFTLIYKGYRMTLGVEDVQVHLENIYRNPKNIKSFVVDPKYYKDIESAIQTKSCPNEEACVKVYDDVIYGQQPKVQVRIYYNGFYIDNYAE